MVTLYVAGRKVDWADAGRIFAEPSTFSSAIELRDDAGQVITELISKPATSHEDDPDWVKAITPEETARRMAEPGYTFEEMKQRLGWE